MQIQTRFELRSP